MFYCVSRWLCYVIFKIFFRYRIYGKNNLPQRGPYIIASNHSSYLDPIAIGILTPTPLNFMAREDLFRNRVFALIIRNLNSIPLDRERQDIKALRRGIKVLKKGGNLVIFPEGRRSLNGELGNPLLGVGFLAQVANTKVVPVYLEGTNLALPVNACFIRFKKIRAFVGEPVDPDNRTAEEIVSLVWERVRLLKERAKS
ncbi:MAG: 1-acyl-sn-glycerol-3-phosphate acyltransferase [Candidatus Omnitrophica bacterium]|nr:1-acyl-sn-glycerol-3-phosphate acyltransferase [Candidatus Omnitrophota bacterium]